MVSIVCGLEKGAVPRTGSRAVARVYAGADILAALASKQIGYITQTGSAITAISRGLPARLVMVFTDKTHHVLVVKPEITSPSQLRGRVVAISQPGGTVHRELLMILEKFKIDPNEVKTASLGDTRTALAGLKAGNVDGAMLMTPLEISRERRVQAARLPQRYSGISAAGIIVQKRFAA